MINGALAELDFCLFCETSLANNQAKANNTMGLGLFLPHYVARMLLMRLLWLLLREKVLLLLLELGV